MFWGFIYFFKDFNIQRPGANLRLVNNKLYTMNNVMLSGQDEVMSQLKKSRLKCEIMNTICV